MNLYSELKEAFNDAYYDDGRVGVAKLYANLQCEADKLLRDYMQYVETEEINEIDEE